MENAKICSDFELTKYTSHVAFMGVLWFAFCGFFWENIPQDIKSAL